MAASTMKLPGATIASQGPKLPGVSEWSEGSLRNVSLRKPVAVPSLKSRASAKGKRSDGGSIGGKSSVAVRAMVPNALVDVNAADEVKFKALVSRRVVFGHDDWKKHKSSGRYFKHLKSILTSKVIGALGPPVSVMTGIASAVVGWNELVTLNYLPEWAHVLHISNLPFSLTAPALSFLLVFRTNASYGRFDEARKMWGLMLNRTRDITRQALSYMARDEHTYEYPKRAQFIRHLQAFPLAYKHHFLQEGSLEEDLKQFTTLTQAERAGILNATHRPNYVLQMMSECVRSCTMDPVNRLAMEANFATFADDIGGSERLFKTPIPLSYTRLTSRFLVLYHMFLPFALWDTLGWVTIPVTATCTAIFFCIEEVGVLIENPFPILALDVIAQSARNNAQELASLHENIRNLIVEDDLEMKELSKVSQEALLPHEPKFVPEPEPEYMSDWDEDAAALATPPAPTLPRNGPIAARGPYST
eukprot:TRINITY_DN7019_c0_g1_i5.p1 TRINITY_DN7019_c0_g1~~TRINITY_DN7019_c0_g1_i5.p1  ORF type:complete len:475 (-),score=30.21 TRINITY_DN7019_c0_g1_i5:16-1440(-)